MFITVIHRTPNDKFKVVLRYNSDKSNIESVINEAYIHTNSIKTPWYENEKLNVSHSIKNGCRSTKQGDIIMATEDDTIRAYRVLEHEFELVDMNSEIEFIDVYDDKVKSVALGHLIIDLISN